MVDVHTARRWYPPDDPVHGFEHVLRVYRLAERLAQAEGADLEIVRAAALLHDAQGGSQAGVQGERENHQQASADFAARVLQAEGWPAERIAAVQHCIRAHRFRQAGEPPATLEAQVLFDADKLDAIGATGVARALAYAMQAGAPFYAPPSPGFVQTGELEAGEPHSAYHEYLFKLRKLASRLHTASGRALAHSRHRLMQAYFEHLAAEMDGEA
ncbi:MAG: HD domain-containing protein [Chloroflexota bacterium]